MVLEPSDADVRNLDPFLSGHVGHDVRVAFRLYPERGPRYDLCERRCASRSYLGAFGSGLEQGASGFVAVGRGGDDLYLGRL